MPIFAQAQFAEVMDEVISGPIIRKISSSSDTAGFVLVKKKDLEKLPTANGDSGTGRVLHPSTSSDASKRPKPPSNARKRSHQNSDQALNSDAYKEVVECWESFAEPGSLESDGVLSLLEDRCRAVTNQFLEVF